MKQNNFIYNADNSPLGVGGGGSFLIAGGGTGGHIFPAIAIANAIKNARMAGLLPFISISPTRG